MPLESDFLGRFLQMWLEGLDRQVYEVAKLHPQTILPILLHTQLNGVSFRYSFQRSPFTRIEMLPLPLQQSPTKSLSHSSVFGSCLRLNKTSSN
jgi:hypothetical protein